MSEINIKPTTAVLKSVSLNKEVHGDENKKALDLSFVFKSPAKQMAGLFIEDENLIKHLWDKDGNPLLGSWCLAYRFQLEGMRLNVDRFKFEDCIIKKNLKVTPIIGRGFEVQMKIRVHPGTQKCADRLWDFRNEDVRISVVQVQQTMDLPPGNGDNVTAIGTKASKASAKAAKRGKANGQGASEKAASQKPSDKKK